MPRKFSRQVKRSRRGAAHVVPFQTADAQNRSNLWVDSRKAVLRAAPRKFMMSRSGTRRLQKSHKTLNSRDA